jgi:ATP-dependent DNA helicase RecG
MLGELELLQAFRNTELDRVERKKSAADTDKISQFICAMANDLPGHNLPGIIFIGQNDDLTCAGTPIDDVLLLRLASLRDNGKIQPIPEMQVHKKTVDGCEIAVVMVAPSTNTPVKFDGRTWIRVGPRRALATGQEERVLVEKRQWGNLPYDSQPCRGATLDGDIDLARFQLEFLPAVIPADVLAQNQRSLDHQLKTLRLISSDGTPTITGILFLAKSPLTWLPGAYVQFRRISGIKLTDETIDVHQISGTLPDQIRQIDELLSLHVRTRAVVGGNLREESNEYPIEALRQLVRNAIIHRSYEGTNAPVRISWYDDRIEIQSPGGPYGQVTSENLGHGATDYRNPTVAGLMVQLRLIERFGVGIQIAKERLAANRNPDLEFESNQQHVLAIVRRRA